MILGVLHARMSSNRMPGKVLAPILGEPMIIRQLERIRRARTLDQVVVATTRDHGDDPLAAYLAQRDIPVFRGSADDAVLRCAKAAEGAEDVTHVARFFCDNPLIDPDAIDAAVTLARVSGAAYVGTGEHGGVEVIAADALAEAAAEPRGARDRRDLRFFFGPRADRFARAELDDGAPGGPWTPPAISPLCGRPMRRCTRPSPTSAPRTCWTGFALAKARASARPARRPEPVRSGQDPGTRPGAAASGGMAAGAAGSTAWVSKNPRSRKKSTPSRMSAASSGSSHLGSPPPLVESGARVAGGCAAGAGPGAGNRTASPLRKPPPLRRRRHGRPRPPGRGRPCARERSRGWAAPRRAGRSPAGRRVPHCFPVRAGCGPGCRRSAAWGRSARRRPAPRA